MIIVGEHGILDVLQLLDSFLKVLEEQLDLFDDTGLEDVERLDGVIEPRLELADPFLAIYTRCCGCGNL